MSRVLCEAGGNRVIVGSLSLVVAVAYGTHLALAVWQNIGTMHHDATVYFTVGRGILNGLTPYVDLFEFKPPGIFLLTAFLLHTADGYTGASVIGAFAVLLVPCLALMSRTDRLWRFAFASVAMLFVVRFGSNVTPEAFGAIFACAYVVVMTCWSSRWRYVPAAIFVCAAVLMKEPLALSILAASLVLHPKIVTVYRSCIWPLLGSIGVWFGIMVTLGYLEPYFSAYFPDTFLIRVNPAVWSSGFRFWKVLPSIWAFSPIFTVLIFVLLVGAARRSWQSALLVLVALYVVTFVGGLALHASDGAFRTIDVFISICFFLALFVGRPVSRSSKMLLAILPFFLALPTSDTEPFWWRTELEAAAIVDQVMDDCDVSRYVHLGNIGSSIPSSMRHSPLGPAFFLSDYTAQVPNLVNSYLDNTRDAELVLFQRVTHVLGSEKFVYDLLEHNVVEGYTTKPWPCATTTLLTDKYALFYRKR